MMDSFYDIVIAFFLYSFCGWLCELVYRSIHGRTMVNPGFLNGPICPIYGLCCLAVIYPLWPYRDNIAILFIFGMIICTALEYITSFILEKLFNTRWWDYSHIKFNINGRVCLSFSLVFGVLSVIANKYLAPLFIALTEQVPAQVKLIVAWVLLGIFVCDIAATVYSILRLNGKLAELEKLSAELKTKLEALQGGSLNLSQRLEKYKEEADDRSQAFRDNIEEFIERFEKLRNARHRFQHRRLFRAFPNMKSTKYAEQLDQIKALFKSRRDKKK